MVTELADVYEVLDALMSVSGMHEERVRQVRAERRAEHGGFEERATSFCGQRRGHAGDREGDHARIDVGPDQHPSGGTGADCCPEVGSDS